MLHLNFGLSFEALADKLMAGYKAAWENPFAPPVIVFPDPNLEHWFKLKWMQKYGALANLNTQFLDKFLFQVLNHKNHSKTFCVGFHHAQQEYARLSPQQKVIYQKIF